MYLLFSNQAKASCMGDFFKSNRYAVDSLSNLNSNTVLQARTQPKMHGGGGKLILIFKT